jgi:glutathione S-transferase
MYKLYQSPTSGNCYKVRLLLHQLNIPVELNNLSIKSGETRTEDFKSKNPVGKVPLLEIEPGKFLSESNAILFYLAEGTRFFPTELLQKAKVLQWMFFEQYSHEPYIAVARSWAHNRVPSGKELELREKLQKGYLALDVMEQELRQKPFLGGENYTIADISLYAYTHVAKEGNFSLERFPSILNWLDRVASQSGYISIKE